MPTSEPVKRYPSFRPSVDTLRLYHFLEDTESWEPISYATLSQILGQDAQTSGRRLLYSAMRMMQREHEVLYGVISGVGIVRLKNEEKIGLPKQRLRRIGRQVKRGRSELKTVEYAALPNSAKVEHNVMLSTLGALDHFGSLQTIKRLTTKVTTVQAPVSVGELVALFEKKKG